MGNFSNGTEGMLYEGKYCEKCHFGDKDCIVWLAHVNYCGDKKYQGILDLFIPNGNLKCKMFVPTKKERLRKGQMDAFKLLKTT